MGLRWWNGEEEKGEGWVFESDHPLVIVNPVDSYVFWTILYIYTVFWLILFILKCKKLYTILI